MLRIGLLFLVVFCLFGCSKKRVVDTRYGSVIIHPEGDVVIYDGDLLIATVNVSGNSYSITAFGAGLHSVDLRYEKGDRYPDPIGIFIKEGTSEYYALFDEGGNITTKTYVWENPSGKEDDAK